MKPCSIVSSKNSSYGRPSTASPSVSKLVWCSIRRFSRSASRSTAPSWASSSVAPPLDSYLTKRFVPLRASAAEIVRSLSGSRSRAADSSDFSRSRSSRSVDSSDSSRSTSVASSSRSSAISSRSVARVSRSASSDSRSRVAASSAASSFSTRSSTRSLAPDPDARCETADRFDRSPSVERGSGTGHRRARRPSRCLRPGRHFWSADGRPPRSWIVRPHSDRSHRGSGYPADRSPLTGRARGSTSARATAPPRRTRRRLDGQHRTRARRRHRVRRGNQICRIRRIDRRLTGVTARRRFRRRSTAPQPVRPARARSRRLSRCLLPIPR